jgi:parvulin-like peptidyl-prolyl isomerase
MAEGWKQVINDLRAALGWPAPKTEEEKKDNPPSPQNATPPVQTSPSANTAIAAPPALAPTYMEAAPEEARPPLTPLQKLYSYSGLLVTFLAAAAAVWYVYGGARPPAPDVVATYDGGQITVQQVRDHLAQLALTPEMIFLPAYETYRLVIDHMALNEMVRRWAAGQEVDTDTKFADAMRHVSESITLDEWVAIVHESEMTAAVRESDIQAYYEANKAAFGGATLSEAREQIRETLAHQNQQQFFEDYIVRLRAEATIARSDELLDAPPPAESQIGQYYEINREQFVVPRRALVDMIFVTPAASDEEADAEARAKAESARAALNTGKDFALVAAEFSHAPYVEAGVLVEAGKDDPALAEQAFALTDEGDLSPVFRAPDGYYILRLRQQQRARTLSLEEAREQIAATLRAENEKAWFEQNADRALFTIHGERYTLGQFYHEYQTLPPELQAQFAGPEGMRRLAGLLIDRLLVLDDAYNRLLDQKNAPLLEEARTAILRQMMHEAEVDKQVAVTDQQAQDYYEQHKELFAQPPEARIRAIRIYVGQTTDDRERAWDRAEAAYKRLAPGLVGQPADFDLIASEYDESEKDAANAGLGEWVRMGDDVLQNLSAHPLHSYLLNLPTDSVSQPFEFGDSIYIVKILERTEPVPLEFEQVKDYIRAELEAQQHEQGDAKLAARLLRDARYTVYDEVILQMLDADADRATQAAP